MQNRIIKFSASWCGPCQRMAPEFKKFQEDHKEVLIQDIDVDADYETASIFGIKGVPTTLFIKDGAVVEKIVGSADLTRLNEVFDKTYSKELSL
jgi:thioredoxin 1